MDMHYFFIDTNSNYYNNFKMVNYKISTVYSFTGTYIIIYPQKTRFI